MWNAVPRYFFTFIKEDTFKAIVKFRNNNILCLKQFMINFPPYFNSFNYLTKNYITFIVFRNFYKFLLIFILKVSYISNI